MGPHRIYSAIFLILSLCLWIYFATHATSEFLRQLEHERRVLQEARVIYNTVCKMPREDIAGHLIDCENARTTSLHHSPHIKALETTASIVSSDIFIVLTEGIRGASHAVGLMGFVVCITLYVSSLIVRAVTRNISQNELSYRDYSASLQSKHQSFVRITELPSNDELICD